jgi:hypothetical protein
MALSEYQNQIIDFIDQAHRAKRIDWTDTPLGPVANLANFQVILRATSPPGIVMVTLRKKTGEQIDHFAVPNTDPFYARIASVYDEAIAKRLDDQKKNIQKLLDELRGLSEQKPKT